MPLLLLLLLLLIILLLLLCFLLLVRLLLITLGFLVRLDVLLGLLEWDRGARGGPGGGLLREGAGALRWCSVIWVCVVSIYVGWCGQDYLGDFWILISCGGWELGRTLLKVVELDERSGELWRQQLVPLAWYVGLGQRSSMPRSGGVELVLPVVPVAAAMRR